jgi:hypothetical protein
MTDLYLEDFRDLSGKKLGHVLLCEQQKMFGEQKSSWSKTGDDRLFLTSLAVLIINLIRPRGKNARS